MAHFSTVSLPLSTWMVPTIFALICFIITCRIQHLEANNRQKQKSLFVSKWLRIWSSLCIKIAPMICIVQSLQYVYGLCHFCEILVSMLNPLQPLAMGYYQLSRIYYCFARDQVYSAKGYPNWLFYVMYIFGALWAIYLATFQAISVPLRAQCGFSSSLRFEANVIEIIPASITVLFIPALLVYLLWDLGTLYVFKMLWACSKLLVQHTFFSKRTTQGLCCFTF